MIFEIGLSRGRSRIRKNAGRHRNPAFLRMRLHARSVSAASSRHFGSCPVVRRLSPAAADRPDRSSASSSATASTVSRICSSVCLAVMKNRSRAAFSSTAGCRIGCTLMPAREQGLRQPQAIACELPRITGTTGVSLAQCRCSSPASWPATRTARARSCSRATRSRLRFEQPQRRQRGGRVGRRNAVAEHEARGRVFQIFDHGLAAGDVAAATAERLAERAHPDVDVGADRRRNARRCRGRAAPARRANGPRRPYSRAWCRCLTSMNRGRSG